MVEHFSDDDVSVSGSEEEEEEEDGMDVVGGSDDSELLSDDDDEAQQQDGDAARTDQRPAGAHHVAALPEQDALLAGELSSEGAVLQLEINELLAETRVDYSTRRSRLERALAELRSALAAIPEHRATGGDVAGFLQALGLPTELTMTFKPPTSVTPVGSYALHAMAQPCSTVDVAVQLPRSCLLEKDNVNYRYHGRRALYLSILARHLAKSHPTMHTQQMAALHGDPTSPALLIHMPHGSTPKSATSANGSATSASATSASAASATASLCLRLIPVLPDDAFALHKLAPDRNNVRWVAKAVQAKEVTANGTAAAANGGGSTAAERSSGEASVSGRGQQQKQQPQKRQKQQQQQPQQQQASKLLPTPHYNASLLRDMLAQRHAEYLKAALGSNARLVDGVLLLKVWARQCGAYGPSDGADGHLLTCLLLHLASSHPLGAAMSALQLLRLVLRELVAGGMGPGRPLAMARAGGNMAEPPPLALFKKHYAAVLVDPTGWLNLASAMSKSALQQLQAAAKHTLAALERPLDADAAFAGCFLSPAGAAGSYDYCWRVTLAEAAAGHLKGSKGAGGAEDAGRASAGVSLVPSDAGELRRQEAAIEQLVRQALGDRASLVRALPRPLKPAPVVPSATAGSSLRLGQLQPERRDVLVCARVDALQALRLVDVGPAADDAAVAARFRALWGDKAELRRFQDGKICEAVVWQVGPCERHAIPDRSVTYILERHLLGCSVTDCSTTLDAVLAERHVAPGADVAAGRAADAALDKLSKQLRALGDLALKVTSVQPLSPVTRHTAPFNPKPHPLAGGSGGADASGRLARCLEPIEVMVQLEGSGRWPDDPTAYSKMKAALGLQLATALESTYGVRVMGSEACLDVLAEGFAFRLLLVSDRDQAMHTKALLASPHTHGHHRAAHTPPRPLILSWHHGLVSGVEGQHAAYGPTVKLAQRWVGAQLLSNHVCGEAVELVVAAAFGGPGPLPAPASRVAGLLRFLQLLARHPWAQKPLVVDPANELSAAQRSQLQRAFDARRAAKQVPAMAICTPKDTSSGHWTHSRPRAPVLQRLVALAARAASQLERLLNGTPLHPHPSKRHSAADTGAAAGAEGPSEADWMSLFQVPLSDFDALIVLRKEALPRADRALPGTSALSALTAEAAEAEAGLDTLMASGVKQRGKKKRRRDEAEAADVVDGVEKKARVVLRAFPQQVVATRPAEKLRSELLIGFDPLDPYLAALEDRFGHLATFCAEPLGGTPVIGVKWRPEAFVAQKLRVAAAHATLEVSLTCAGGAGNSDGRVQGILSPDGGVAGLVVPHVAQVVAEIRQLGAGLVSHVHLC